MTSLKLRPYQEDCIEAIQRCSQEGHRRQLISLATGGGKTVVFASLIKRLDCRSLILAHTNELLEQARDKIHMVSPYIDVGIINGNSKLFDAKVVVASIQSAIRSDTLEQLQSCGFGLCVVDECHHAATDSQRQLIHDLGFGRGTDRLLVGCTATPYRSDAKGLGEVFDVIAYQKTTRELIEAGYLCQPEGRKVATNIDFSDVVVSDGDFASASLAKVMDTPELNRLVVDSYLQNSPQAKAICFSVTVQHSHNLAYYFNKAGISASVVSGSMSHEERTSIIQAYLCGNVQVLCNCQILTEGFDAPETACVIVARPTKSRLLYQQMVGRGLRLWPNKRSCLVLDFCDKAHNLCDVESVLLLDAEEYSSRHLQGDKPAKKDFVKLPPNLNSKLKSAIVCFDPLSESFTWQREGAAYVLHAGSDSRLIVFPQRENHGVTFEHNGKSQCIVGNIPFEYAFATAEDFARGNRNLFVVSDRQASWRDQPVSSKQLEYIRKHGYKAGIEKLTRGQASDLISSGALRKVS